MMNTLERFHIYKVKRLDNQVNGKRRVKYNAVFDKIHINSQKLLETAFTAVSPSIRLDFAQSQTATIAART